MYLAMSKRGIDTNDQLHPPQKKLASISRFLYIHLPHLYKPLLADLVLIYVSSVDLICTNSKEKVYLYKLCSLLLDCGKDLVQLFVTKSGIDCKNDDDEGWGLVENDETPYEGGTFLCKPLDRILPAFPPRQN